jgi:hypothetical protein
MGKIILHVSCLLEVLDPACVVEKVEWSIHVEETLQGERVESDMRGDLLVEFSVSQSDSNPLESWPSIDVFIYFLNGSLIGSSCLVPPTPGTSSIHPVFLRVDGNKRCEYLTVDFDSNLHFNTTFVQPRREDSVK